MNARSPLDLLLRDRGVYDISETGGIVLKNPHKFTSQTLDLLVWNLVFGETEEVRSAACWIIRRAALELGVIPSSIQGLYEARGRKEFSGFTVPAINIRGLSYDVARAVLRAAMNLKAGAFVFELARSESKYTGQKPAEFAGVVVAAALREGYAGPLFIQGDHYQANANKYAKDPEGERQGIRDFCQESVAAGYYNIDIDTSTLVDLSKPGVHEQQRANFENSAKLATFVRSIEPQGVTISLGGEIGEVGKQNSTVEELSAYMDGFQAALFEARGEEEGTVQDQRAIGDNSRGRCHAGWQHRPSGYRFRNPAYTFGAGP